MSGKVHAFMVFVGVLLMTAAAGLYVRYGLGRDDVSATPESNRTDRTVHASPDPSGSALPDPVATPTPTPTPTATPKATPKATPTPTRKPTTTAAPATWRLVWSDEFNGAALDTGKWGAIDSAAIDDACATSRAVNVAVSGGTLDLSAVREDYTCGASTTAWTAGLIEGRASFTYGAFEVRATSPNAADTSAGIWPVFSLRSAAGEITALELPGGSGYRTVNQAVAQGGTTQGNTYTVPSGSPGDGAHTYRVEWEPGVIRWYVDGVEVFRRDRGTTSFFDAAFAQAYDLRLGIRVGGAGGAPDAASASPSVFAVDYVRVYQR